MFEKIFIPIVTMIMTALVTYLATRKKNEAEIDRLRAESDKIKAETELLKKRINGSVDQANFLLKDNGLKRLYFPNDNEQRNTRKREVVAKTQTSIRLLAITGHSYLAISGHKFKDKLIPRLEDGLLVEILILNPWSDSAFLVACGESKSNNAYEQADEIFEKVKKGRLKGFDPVAFIEGSTYYKTKFTQSTEGYEALRENYDKEITVRVIDHEIVGTILFADKMCFFEPYLNVNLQERMDKFLHTFEAEFAMDSGFAKNCKAYWDVLWALAIKYDDFIREEDVWKDKLRKKYQA